MGENENIFLSMNLAWDSGNRDINSTRHLVPGEIVKFLREEYLNIPLNINLNDGFDPNSEGPDPELWDGGWRNVLDCLLWNGRRLNNLSENYSLKNVLNGANIVCTRGAVTSIGLSPDQADAFGFKFLIDKFDNVLFIKEMNTEAKLEKHARRTERERQTSYWSYKLKTVLAGHGREYKAYTTTIKTDTESNKSEDENQVKFFCLTNVDCRDDIENFLDIHIQANKLFNNNYFEQKAMNWWIQGTVVMMNDVVVGFRNDDGILLRAERVNLDHLHEGCQWNGNLCLQAIQLFFTELTNRYDDLVNSEQMLVLERKPNSKDITFSVIPRTEILTNEFRQFFT
uniref:Decapping nuclease n=1 Tax=Panagrolaimus sp. JU765 TaxID=591449 RepID=A0AC34R410_9BILA